MNTKKCGWLFVGFLLVAVIVWAMGQYDYARLVAGQHPMFARIQLHPADGGSVQYLGLGYTVTDLHELRWGIEMQPGVRETVSHQVAPFLVGPTLNYWTPFVSREHTKFIVETNNVPPGPK
jgi:hypothetical protein